MDQNLRSLSLTNIHTYIQHSANYSKSFFVFYLQILHNKWELLPLLLIHYSKIIIIIVVIIIIISSSSSSSSGGGGGGGRSRSSKISL